MTTFNAAGTFTTGSGTSATPPLPSGIAIGDLLIAYVGVGNTSAITVSSGWTLGFSGNNGTIGFAWAWRLATGSDIAPTFSWTVSAGYDSRCFGYTGNPYSASPIGATSQNLGTGTALTCPAITTTADNSTVIAVLIDGINSTIPTPTGYTSRVNATSGSPVVGSDRVADKVVATSGTSSGSIAVTVTSGDWRAALIEIVPSLSTPVTRLGQQYIEVVHSGADNKVRLAQQYTEVVHTGVDNKVRLDQQYAEVITEFVGAISPGTSGDIAAVELGADTAAFLQYNSGTVQAIEHRTDKALLFEEDLGQMAASEANNDIATFSALAPTSGDVSVVEGSKDTASFLGTVAFFDSTEGSVDIVNFNNLPYDMEFTRTYGQALSSGTTTARFTRTYATVLATVTLAHEERFTRTYAQVLANNTSDPQQRFTRAYVQVICQRTPDFSWVDDMFKEILFPYDISLNSVAAETYESDDIIVDSGVSQRVSRWKYPLVEVDVSYGVRTMEQLHALKEFWRVVHGTQYGFLYEDHIDFTSTFATRFDARAAPDITPFDQQIGVGDNTTKVFQLVKNYTRTNVYDNVTTYTEQRPIYRPKPNTAVIGVNDVQVSNWSVDVRTGLITFTVPYTYTFTGVNLSITNRSSGKSTISGPAGAFNGFSVGDNIVMSGWANTFNNTDETLVCPITAKATDASSITVQLPVNYGIAETRQGVTIYVHPAPKLGQTVTAGYEFWVPVRFNTKKLPLTLQEYGIGSANEVKLIEIRPGETG